ncbi:MAG: ATP cone domain-containing protein [Anaerococcus obesiensis]|uniref:Anaerobic ribonucleoside triphosphate reductase n=1 Tax=Anaerococcus vaginalis TaxID=33037 RepID=A0A6N2RJ32_9FIRM|nr:ATP cone domain-containing protein [Anaerococcus vaginalis]MDU0945927.1 ATP cone domain-containing protein [Anaerococcus vaginalis]MDU1030226.1 ATP cone domain-containing protein [Anaerococcus vaginalis]
MSDLTKIIIDYYQGKNLSIEEIADELDKAKIEVIENFLDNKLYVKKRNGKIELFDVDKILRSIKNAARDGNIDLNTSDISILKNDLIKMVEKNHKRIIPTAKIKEYVENILEKDGYKKVLESYKSYIKSK